MAVTDKKADQRAVFARAFLDFAKASVAINQAAALVGAAIPWQGIPLPFQAIKGWLVENVQVFATAVAATASVDVLIGAVSVLTGAITPVAGTVVQGALAAVASRIGKPGDQLNCRVTTNGTGTITDLGVTVTIRPYPLNNEA